MLTLNFDKVLLRIDAERYQHALAEAEAAVSARKADYDMKRREAARRAQLSGVVVSSESREASASTASSAAALYQQAQAARDTAALNLKRTDVLAPVDGYVTNLEVHGGDYASIGRPLLALVVAVAMPAVLLLELDRYLPFLSTTKVLMAAVRHGVDTSTPARGWLGSRIAIW